MEELDTEEQQLLKGYELHGAQWESHQLKNKTDGAKSFDTGDEVMLGGTFGKPLPVDTQEVGKQASGNQNASQGNEHGNSDFAAVEGENLFDKRESRSPSPNNEQVKLPGIESNKGSVFNDDDGRSDNLSKLVKPDY